MTIRARDTWAVIVVVAEKPSVARDIARVLGASQRRDGYLEGQGYAVTWAVGHLVTLCEPEGMDARWKGWRLESLPMLPSVWPLQVIEQTRDQFQVIARLMQSASTREIICATDAGREGELIFRLIAEAAHCTKPVKRLWISSLTESAIRQGFARLKEGSQYDALAAAARGRSRADWLVGMNLTRAYTLCARSADNARQVYSVGRVQTPTLAILVERDRLIRNFVPEDYFEVALDLTVRDDPAEKSFEARYVRADKPDDIARLPADGVEAGELAQRARTGVSKVSGVEREEKRAKPQLLYDLTELQRHAHRLYGLSASRTLEVAQRLYEEYKLISYPRTDSRHLSSDVEKTLPEIVRSIEAPYRALLEPGTGERPLGKRFVDDAQVSDHHAIIPTGKASRLTLGSDEGKLYDLICRRLLSAWQKDHVWAVTRVRIEVTPAEATPAKTAAKARKNAAALPADQYLASGQTVLEEGHRKLDVKTRKASEPSLEPQIPPVEAGQLLYVREARCDAKRTRPPQHHSEASLLTAMETAGRTLDDRELSAAMRERGLGTPATRAATIETLLSREYIVRVQKSLHATAKGEALIDLVHPHVKSPAMTGEWEHRLREIERGRADLDAFMRDIERYVREVVGGLGGTGANSGVGDQGSQPSHARMPSVSSAQAASAPALKRRAATSDLELVLREDFGFAAFRPHQQAVCAQIVAGRNVLLVMPTGAGKSLCYQLPGVARGGTTLVISPLIALMEDQFTKLRALGFSAARIHSGLAREDAREACRQYLRGDLSFLFIAPERLRVPGFAELLAKRPPTLIAIDEAHCISQWGHDFRPDYRMLRDRLPRPEGCPVVALTATATPAVQRDILEQLDIRDAVRSIHGFRRTNLAVQIVEAMPRTRSSLAHAVLKQSDRLPAIVYAPTRKHADELASELSRGLRAASYHAGKDAGVRDRVQTSFLEGKLDVVVATVAFGMGVDKADVRTVLHLAGPSTVESYYQEIGRAGRDGKPSLALMLCSGADRRMHQFFFERDYPALTELERVYAALKPEPLFKGSLSRVLKLEDEDLDRMLDKLWVHGAVRIDADDRVTRGTPDFRRAYPVQRRNREAQLSAMTHFLYAESCRMLALVQHFGDEEDHGRPCGLCDRCRPQDAVVSERMQHAEVRSQTFARSAKPRHGKRSSGETRTASATRPASTSHEVDAPTQLVEALRSFRRGRAQTLSIPAFRVLTDRVLIAVAREQPRSEAELLAIAGIGPSIVRKYGVELLGIVRSHD